MGFEETIYKPHVCLRSRQLSNQSSNPNFQASGFTELYSVLLSQQTKLNTINIFTMFKNINLLALSLLSATSLAAPTPAPQSGTGVNDPNYSWSVTGWSAGCARSGCYYGKFTSPQDPPPTPN